MFSVEPFMGVSLGFDRSSEQSKTGGVKELLI